MYLKELQPVMTMEQHRYRVSTLEQHWEKIPLSYKMLLDRVQSIYSLHREIGQACM